MIHISNNRELYAILLSIRDWEEILQENAHKLPPESIAYIQEHIASKKRRCREYMRKHRFVYDDEPRMVKNDGDSVIVLVPLPRTITSEESAEAWFEYHEHRECAPSQYDCTGQLFTSWYRIIERNGRFYAYHSIGMDV